jgi:hypothetical protein
LYRTRKRVEGALLCAEMRLRRPRGRRIEGPVHPFVGAILLGVGRQDPLMLNAQPDPPHESHDGSSRGRAAAC